MWHLTLHILVLRHLFEPFWSEDSLLKIDSSKSNIDQDFAQSHLKCLQFFNKVFSSPDPNVLTVSYCDHPVSSVHCLS